MGAALLIEAIAAPMATLPGSRARVWVGPPFALREESRFISEDVFVVAQEKVPWDTRLWAAVAGEVTFTVPLPAKSPPLVLLAIMVLAMLRVLPPSAYMPPPALPAALLESVELETITVPPLKMPMPPPNAVALFSNSVELATVVVPPVAEMPAEKRDVFE